LRNIPKTVFIALVVGTKKLHAHVTFTHMGKNDISTIINCCKHAK